MAHAAGPLGLEIQLRSGEVAKWRVVSENCGCQVAKWRCVSETRGAPGDALRRAQEAPEVQNRFPEAPGRLKN